MSNLKKKSCLHSIGNISYRIFMKLDQNICFDIIYAKSEYGSCRIKQLGHQVKS